MNSNRMFDHSGPDPEKPRSRATTSSSLRGKLLVATEKTINSNFERAVVLLLQDDEQGTFGVALNKPAGKQIRSAWEKLTGNSSVDELTIVAGGPLKGPVFAIHQMPSLSDAEMPGGLHFSAQANKLQQLMQQFENPYRIVVGIAGWKSGQLHSELESGNWYVLPLDAETVFDDPEWMWDSCIYECGRQQVVDLLGHDDFPEDPSLN